jgi:SAM-dependent methyltransferase
MSTTPAVSNDEMQAYWNGPAGEKWVRLQDQLDVGLQPFADAVFAAAMLQTGEAVLDVGCGCGATTLQAAKLVGTSGRATGVDISAPMITRARDRACAQNLGNASFACVDAQSGQPDGTPFDVLVSRFGVMFFSDPEKAFAKLRGSIRPSGRLSFICWQGLDRNPWLLLPALAAMKHVAIQPPADPQAPGPFAFADADRVSKILVAAGWRDVAYAPFERPIAIGGDKLEDAVEFMMEMGPAAQALRDADDATRHQVRESLAEAMSPHLRPGGVQMDSAAWVFTAKSAS